MEVKQSVLKISVTVAGAMIIAGCFATVGAYMDVQKLKRDFTTLEKKQVDVADDVSDTKKVVCLIGIRLNADRKTLEDACTRFGQ